MKKIILIFLFFSISSISKINATVQRSNKLIFHGEEYYVQFFPLELFFENNPDKRLNSEHWNTGLSRGYIATFEICYAIHHSVDEPLLCGCCRSHHLLADLKHNC